MSWHLRKQVGVIAYPMYSASVTFLRLRKINIEIKKNKIFLILSSDEARDIFLSLQSQCFQSFSKGLGNFLFRETNLPLSWRRLYDLTARETFRRCYFQFTRLCLQLFVLLGQVDPIRKSHPVKSCQKYARRRPLVEVQRPQPHRASRAGAKNRDFPRSGLSAYRFFEKTCFCPKLLF